MGKWLDGRIRPCRDSDLENYEKVGSSSRANQGVALPPDPIMRNPTAIHDLVDPVQFHETFRAVSITDGTWLHHGSTVEVTVRGCSAFVIRQDQDGSMASRTLTRRWWVSNRGNESLKVTVRAPNPSKETPMGALKSFMWHHMKRWSPDFKTI